MSVERTREEVERNRGRERDRRENEIEERDLSEINEPKQNKE